MQGSKLSAEALTGLRVEIITPHGLFHTAVCDSVTMPLLDGTDNTGGGSIGIRRGHIGALMALSCGSIHLKAEGAPPVRIAITGGYASVDRNTVKIITESAQTE